MFRLWEKIICETRSEAHCTCRAPEFFHDIFSGGQYKVYDIICVKTRQMRTNNLFFTLRKAAVLSLWTPSTNVQTKDIHLWISPCMANQPLSPDISDITGVSWLLKSPDSLNNGLFWSRIKKTTSYRIRGPWWEEFAIKRQSLRKCFCGMSSSWRQSDADHW